MYSVETGKAGSAYRVRLTTANRTQAEMVYAGYLVHSGGKKRLRCGASTLHRVITDRCLPGLRGSWHAARHPWTPTAGSTVARLMDQDGIARPPARDQGERVVAVGRCRKG